MKAIKSLRFISSQQYGKGIFQRIHKPCIPHHRDTSKFALLYIEIYPKKVVALQKDQATIIKARIALTLLCFFYSNSGQIQMWELV